jgi:tRNA(Ile)-lysidine synthase TilS/MesJ
MRRLIGALIKADKVFNMFAKNDKILVGVSGGKDSTLLLMALNYYVQKINDKYK